MNKKQFFLDGKYKGIYLTLRETQCLTYLPFGWSAKKIGKHLGISYRTVETHLANLKKKLDCQSRSDLIAIILKEKIWEWN